MNRYDEMMSFGFVSGSLMVFKMMQFKGLNMRRNSGRFWHDLVWFSDKVKFQGLLLL